MRIKLAILVLAVTFNVWGQREPEPTPTPRPTPTPTPAPRPPEIRTDRSGGPLVTARYAPEDYHSERWHRGTVHYEATRRNYAWHRVLLPPPPLTIQDGNFSQLWSDTVAFWREVGSDVLNIGAAGRGTPVGHAVTSADIGCLVRIAPATDVTRGIYRVTGTNGAAWIFDRSPGRNGASSTWELWCPVQDFTGYEFMGCNLRNVWLTSSNQPSLAASLYFQGDVPEETE